MSSSYILHGSVGTDRFSHTPSTQEVDHGRFAFHTFSILKGDPIGLRMTCSRLFSTGFRMLHWLCDAFVFERERERHTHIKLMFFGDPGLSLDVFKSMETVTKSYPEE